MTTPMKTRLSRSTLSALMISVARVTTTRSERNYSTYQLAPRFNKRTAPRAACELAGPAAARPPCSQPVSRRAAPCLRAGRSCSQPVSRSAAPCSWPVRAVPRLLAPHHSPTCALASATHLAHAPPPPLEVGRVRVHVQALFECLEMLREKEYL
jgi:hypothetical protein